MTSEEVNTLERQHLDKAWPTAPKEEFVWTVGSAHSTLPHLRVLRVGPLTEDPPWIYITIGAWETSGGAEFFLFAPDERAIHVETLFLVAYYARVRAKSFGPGATLNIGRGWMEGSPLEYLLVSQPHPWPDEVAQLHVSEDIHVRYLWLLPITAAEAHFRAEHGVDALEARLEGAEVNYLDPLRSSAV